MKARLAESKLMRDAPELESGRLRHPNSEFRIPNSIKVPVARVAWTAVLFLCVPLLWAGAEAPASRGGAVTPNRARPRSFSHRIWAACDFEGLTPDYGWFGRAETNDIPRYPGNSTALAAAPGPYRDFSAVMTGINPVPGPRMGKVNQLWLRYHLTGGSEATFQHFSLTREDNWHIRATGLETGRWAGA